MAFSLSGSAARAARIIRYTPGITRTELATRLNVAVTTVNPVVARLIDRGIVIEKDAPRRANSVGRPRAGLVCKGDQSTFGTVIWSHGFLDTALATFAGTILWRRREPIAFAPRDTEIVEAAEEIFAQARSVTGVQAPAALVLGLPAPYERGVGVAGSTLTTDSTAGRYAQWFEADPMAILKSRFELPVVVENDANLGALGETADGCAQGRGCVIYVKLSASGIGAGITVQGELLRGSHGFAGEIAHVRVDDDSLLLCNCGSRGCLEGKLGSALLEPMADNYGSDITYDRLLELVAQGTPGPVRVLQDAGRTVGRVLADMSTFLNPDAIAIDAGSPEGSEVLIRGVAEQIELSAPPFIQRGLELLSSTLRDDAPVVGALQLARTACIDRPAQQRRSKPGPGLPVAAGLSQGGTRQLS